jgi:hypothetical protein
MESVLKMFNPNAGKGKGLIWATATATAAGVTNLTPTLPGGAIGMPRKIKASGSVAATVTLNISNSQQIIVLVNPNAPPTEEDVPSNAFPGKQGSVSVVANLSAAGNVFVAVGFAP